MNRSRNKRDQVLHPVLQECSKIESDPFWSGLYMDLAMGKNSNNLFVSQDLCVVFKLKSKLNYPLEGKKAETICAELKPLLNKCTNLSSDTDNTERQKKFASEAKTFSDKNLSSWSSVKKKGIKDMMLIDFVISQKRERDLTNREAAALLDLLKKLFLMKAIHSKDVNLADNKIVSIDKLDYDAKQRTFWHPSMLSDSDLELSVAKSSALLDHDIDLEEKWKKYLETVFKNAAV